MSIFLKIIASFLIISVFPLTIFGVVIVNKVFDIVKKNAFEDNIFIAQQITWQLDTYFDTIIKALESLSGLPEMKEFDKERVDKILESYYSSYTIYYGYQTVFEANPFKSFAVLDNKGIVKTVYPLDEQNIGADYSDKIFYQEVVKKRDAYVSPDILISELTGAPILTIAVPVFADNGGLSYIIEADIRLESVSELVNQLSVGKTGFLYAVNRKGIITTHSDIEFVSQMRNIEDDNPGLLSVLFEKAPFEGSLLYPRNNPNKIIAYSFPKQVDWVLALDQSLPEVLAVPMGLRSQFALVLFLVVFLVVIVGFILSREITGPIKKLSNKAAEIGIKQNMDMDTEIIIRTDDEIEDLSLSFSQMIKRLRIKTTELEKRTEELQKRVEEINKWHRLTVGRELRMVELKKEIKELKDKSGKNDYNRNV